MNNEPLKLDLQFQHRYYRRIKAEISVREDEWIYNKTIDPLVSGHYQLLDILNTIKFEVNNKFTMYGAMTKEEIQVKFEEFFKK